MAALEGRALEIVNTLANKASEKDGYVKIKDYYEDVPNDDRIPLHVEFTGEATNASLGLPSLEDLPIDEELKKSLANTDKFKKFNPHESERRELDVSISYDNADGMPMASPMVKLEFNNGQWTVLSYMDESSVRQFIEGAEAETAAIIWFKRLPEIYKLGL